MMSNASTQTRRRRLRFSLRTLLLLVAACAVGTWFYLTGWPWLVAYWQQIRFERAVKQLRVGTTALATWNQLPHAEHFTCSYVANVDRVLTGTSRYALTNATYFVHFKYPVGYQGTMMDAPSTSVEIFRLPPAPPNYKARRAVSNDSQENRIAPPTPGESSDKAYEDDFLDFIISDRKDHFGLKPERIYSDPPAPSPPSEASSPSAH